MRHMPVPDFVYGLGVRLGGRPRTSAAAARLAPSPTEPLHLPGVVNSKALPKATSCATTPTGALRARRTGEDRAGAWRLGFFANAEEAALYNAFPSKLFSSISTCWCNFMFAMSVLEMVRSPGTLLPMPVILMAMESMTP